MVTSYEARIKDLGMLNLEIRRLKRGRVLVFRYINECDREGDNCHKNTDCKYLDFILVQKNF